VFLKYGLLGFLSYEPKTGYELSKMFFESLKPSLSQIYRKLNVMAEEGLVECERIEQEKAPYKNIFSITEKGTEELKRWLKETPEFVGERDPLLLRVWFGSRVDKKHIIKDIKLYAKQVKNELEYYEQTARPLIEIGLRGAAEPLDRLYWTLILDRAIAQYGALVEWAETAAKKISEFDDR
jgi:PadR family transcriptional regulator, regulatory protein AphA